MNNRDDSATLNSFGSKLFFFNISAKKFEMVHYLSRALKMKNKNVKITRQSPNLVPQKLRINKM